MKITGKSLISFVTSLQLKALLRSILFFSSFNHNCYNWFSNILNPMGIRYNHLLCVTMHMASRHKNKCQTSWEWEDKMTRINSFYWKMLLLVRKGTIKYINLESLRSVDNGDTPTNKDKHVQHNIENPSWTTIIVSHKRSCFLQSIDLISAILKVGKLSQFERRVNWKEIREHIALLTKKGPIQPLLNQPSC